MVKLSLHAIPLLVSGLLLGCGASARRSNGTSVDQLGVSREMALATDSIPLEQSELGRALFFDRTLSKDSSMSCATCHVPEYGFAEPQRVSHGIGPRARRRNTPTLLNVGLQERFDWDGRAASLEEQLLGVFSSLGDMGIDVGAVVARVEDDADYKSWFESAFGRGPDIEALLSALAGYQRTLVVGDSRFDRFYFGGDSTALTASEHRGWKVFIARGCTGCHGGFTGDRRGKGITLFTDHRFHNLGVGYQNGRMADVGRYGVTRRPEDWGSFKTPSLRNVELTSPYMHDGSIDTLEGVIEFYAKGGISNPNLDVTIRQRSLTSAERADLVAFLKALTTVELGPVLSSQRRHAESRRTRGGGS